MKKKYNISKEFAPFHNFTPILNRMIFFLAKLFLKTPSLIYKDKDLDVKTIKIKGYKDETLSLIVLTPKNISLPSPGIIFIHGGGFVFEGGKSHFYIASEYAKRCSCQVIYIKYNLAPKYPFPYPQMECFSAYKYIFNHIDELGLDINKIGITGDSAGGTLSVTSMLLARENNFNHYPIFQLLIYPWLDNRNISTSYLKYNDTPMWNSTLSKKSKKYTNKKGIKFPPYIDCPVLYSDFSFLPDAYIEVAQYDCLHDDGLLYKDLLLKENKEVYLYEIKNSMHGYEQALKSKTVKDLINQRINYINNKFYEKN